MKSFDIKAAIEIYSKEKRDVKTYFVKRKKEKELHTIEVDVERSFGFLKGEDKVSLARKEIFKEILFKVLKTIPVEYLQSMSEIVSVIVYYNFKDIVEEKLKQIDIAEIKSKSNKSNINLSSTSLSKDNVIWMSENESTSKMSESRLSDASTSSDNFDYDQFIDEELFKKTCVTVTNVLKEKYLPLVDDNFKMYLRYNSIFIRMMAKRNKKIYVDESLKYMNTTLTWFIRSLVNIEDILAVYGYFLCCPTSFPFLLLVKFYDKIDNKIPIERLNDNIYQELVTLEREFLEVEFEMSRPTTALGKKTGLITVGSIIAVGAAIIIYRLSKRDE
ncbi:hypothetical protein CWI39_0147p0010 [Hamiltosporidium magnivora]|uniref:Rab-GAP TBC domain-containing protein n=1 Tax=Hamiltosporidium magnivora TaxID=148818 RepID=A0A4Q9LKD8_9MICR|nr:hypothetical protein CWI39_0147p0010 [Hamiltosporidium magnivora]